MGYRLELENPLDARRLSQFCLENGIKHKLEDLSLWLPELSLEDLCGMYRMVDDRFVPYRTKKTTDSIS